MPMSLARAARLALVLTTALAAASPLAATAASAQTAAPSAVPQPAPSTAPSPEAGSLQAGEQNGIRYVSGGIGDDGLREIRAAEASYNLHLLFAERSGDYLASVPVTIEDGKGQRLLNATASGPYFLARLPAGTYKVTVASDDKTQTRTVSVPAEGKASLSFYW